MANRENVRCCLEQVDCRFPNGTQALRDITLDLSENQFTAVIGPSGAGKSTLIRVLNGLVRPTGGKVWLDSFEISSASNSAVRAARRNIGMVFQQANLVRRLSALENVLLGRLGYLPTWRTSFKAYPKEEKEFAYSLLERVGLADQAYQRADTLSGGQQQRVGIARALAQQPQMVLADEPVASLDFISAQQVMHLLRQVYEEDGIMVVVNLHDLRVVRDYADRVIGLRQGQVVFDGPPAALNEGVIGEIFQEDASHLAPDQTPQLVLANEEV